MCFPDELLLEIIHRVTAMKDLLSLGVVHQHLRRLVSTSMSTLDSSAISIYLAKEVLTFLRYFPNVTRMRLHDVHVREDDLIQFAEQSAALQSLELSISMPKWCPFGEGFEALG